MTVHLLPVRPQPPTFPANESALLLDGAINVIEVARNDSVLALEALPENAPLFAAVDLVTGLGHLRQAAFLLGGVIDTLIDTGGVA